MIGILLGLAVLGGAAFGGPAVGIAAVFGLAGLQLGWLRPIPATLLVVAAVAGFWRAGGEQTPFVPPSWAGSRHAFYATVSSNPASSGATRSFVASIKPASQSMTEMATACVTAPVAPRIGRGDEVYLTGEAKTAAQVSPSFASYLQRSGCSIAVSANQIEVLKSGTGVTNALDRIRARISERVQAAIPGDAGALVTGLATGDDAALSDDARAAFFATGTSHITAVSGSNLALFIGFFAAAGGAAGWRRRLVWQLATVSAIWLYVVLIGLGAPAFRSALVATLAIVAARFGRKPDLLTLSVLVAAAQVMIRPGDIHLLAFRLSTAAAIGLLLALGGPVPTSACGWVWRGALASAAANLATAPFLLATVGLPFPLRSIPANLAIAPIVDLLFPLSVLISLVALVGGALFLAPPIEAIARVCLEIVHRFANLPGATLAPGSLPITGWALAGTVVAIFCAASPECRGGVVRLTRRWSAGGSAANRFALAVVGSAVVGAALAWIVR